MYEKICKYGSVWTIESSEEYLVFLRSEGKTVHLNIRDPIKRTTPSFIRKKKGDFDPLLLRKDSFEERHR